MIFLLIIKKSNKNSKDNNKKLQVFYSYITYQI